MKSTHSITYRYNVDGAVVEITRRHVRTAYAANGNVGNPTEYFVWDAAVDGVMKVTAGRRADAYELALGHAVLASDNRSVIGGTRDKVRNWVVVKNEMAANYEGSRR